MTTANAEAKVSAAATPEASSSVELPRLRAILESMLFAAGEPVTVARIGAALDDVPKDQILEALAEMRLAYTREGRGIVLEQVAGGYQLRTGKEFAPYIRKLLAAKPLRLSRPLLETLAIVAYRQPITRPEMEELRGVDCGAVIDTLLDRRLIRNTGRKDAPGRPLLYGTTAEFLEIFGLKDLNSLPDLSELREIDDAIELDHQTGNQPGPPALNAETDSGIPAELSSVPVCVEPAIGTKTTGEDPPAESALDIGGKQN